MNAHRSAHLSYLRQLDEQGHLLGAGPVLSDDESLYCGHGLILLRADSLDQALALAAADPFHQAGIRTFTVTPWLLSEGEMHQWLRPEG